MCHHATDDTSKQSRTVAHATSHQKQSTERKDEVSSTHKPRRESRHDIQVKKGDLI